MAPSALPALTGRVRPLRSPQVVVQQLCGAFFPHPLQNAGAPAPRASLRPAAPALERCARRRGPDTHRATVSHARTRVCVHVPVHVCASALHVGAWFCVVLAVSVCVVRFCTFLGVSESSRVQMYTAARSRILLYSCMFLAIRPSVSGPSHYAANPSGAASFLRFRSASAVRAEECRTTSFLHVSAFR